MKIFISHTSKNKEYGNALVVLLRQLGIKEEEIIFTSNIAYGIPVGQNIFHWLKAQIQDKPFVIYILSEEYFDSVACLNEMGAAWIVENKHAAIFTPNFDLTSKEFQSGALDPREIGFYINDEDRVLSFIQLLSPDFDISTNAVLISQSVKAFLKEIEGLKSKPLIPKEVRNVKTPEVVKTIREEKTASQINIDKSELPTDNGIYSKLLKGIAERKIKDEELLLLHYIKETGRVRLMIGWQEGHEVSNIEEWEKINDIKDILSQNYARVISRYELRGLTEVSAVTASDNPKEVKLKEEILSNILDLPDSILAIIDDVVKRNYYEQREIETADDLPF
jgi:hypothetical protein